MVNEHGTHKGREDYANSIDAQKRDLEPLVAIVGFCEWGDYAVLYQPDGSHIDSFGPNTLARARCLGKALETRSK